MAELMHFNIPGAFNEGFDRGTQMRKSSRLAELASQAYGAPQQDQSRLVQMAIQNDPTSGLQLGQSLRSENDSRTKEMVNMARLLRAAPPESRAAVYRSMVPQFTSMGMQGFPTDYTPESAGLIDQTADAIVQAYGFADGGTPAGLREFQAMTQGLSAEDQMKARRVALGLDGRASSAGVGFDTFEDTNGFKRPQRNNPRSGQVEIWYDEQGRWVPLGQAQSGGPAPGARTQTTFTGADGMPVRLDLDSDVPPAVLADLMQNESAWAAAPDGATANLPDQRVAQFSGTPAGLGRGRRAEDEAAAVEAAKQGVQLSYLPTQQAIETQGAVERERGVQTARAEVERGTAQATRARQNQESIDTLKQVMNLLPQASGGALAAGRDRVAGAFGISTEGAQAGAQLKLLAAKLIANVPRFEGPQSNIDVQFYREAAGDVANDQLPVGTRLAAAQRMLDIAQQYSGTGQYGPAPSDGAPAQGSARRLKFNPATGRLE